MGCGRLGGELEGSVSGGFHQGEPRVSPVNIVMAVQGSLKPRHQRLEGRPVPLGKQQARGGGHC